MTDEDLAEIEGRLAHGSGIDWILTKSGHAIEAIHNGDGRIVVCKAPTSLNDDLDRLRWFDDADIITNSRQDLARLIAEVRLLRGILADLAEDSGHHRAGLALGVREGRRQAIMEAVRAAEALRLDDTMHDYYRWGVNAAVRAIEAIPVAEGGS